MRRIAYSPDLSLENLACEVISGVPLDVIDAMRVRLRQAGLKYRFVWRGPRPRHKLKRRPEVVSSTGFTLKANATHADLYLHNQ